MDKNSSLFNKLFWWLGDNVATEIGRAGLGAALNSVKGNVTGRLEKHSRLAELNADMSELEKGGYDLSPLRRRLREAKDAFRENQLTKIVCTAIYNVPGGNDAEGKPQMWDPRELLKFVNDDAADDGRWQEFIDILDTDNFAEHAKFVGSWIANKAKPSAETRTAIIASGNQFASWLDELTARHRR